MISEYFSEVVWKHLLVELFEVDKTLPIIFRDKLRLKKTHK